MEFHPLTPDRWRDFTRLFGKRGAYGGCWCMWWRSTRREFEARQGAGNRRAMKRLVDAGHVPGIIGYDDEMPVAWCSVAPRGKRLPPVSSFMGVPEVFARAGFIECARPSAARRIMRRTIAE